MAQKLDLGASLSRQTLQGVRLRTSASDLHRHFRQRGGFHRVETPFSGDKRPANTNDSPGSAAGSKARVSMKLGT